MTKAIEIIASAAKLRNSGAAIDILVGYNLATNMTFTDSVEWDELPLGAGTDLVDFAKSAYYTALGDDFTYGDIALAWLDYRRSKFTS